MASETKAHDQRGVRLFKSDFMEFFTHISPVAVLVIFLPILFFFLYRSAVETGAVWKVVLSFLLGVAIWTPTEYLLHRFVFHFSPPNPSESMQRFLFLMHGVHHAEPRVKTRLVMPPVVNLPLAAVFYLLFKWVLGSLLGQSALVPGVFAGFLFGYLLYDMTHYALHHFSFKGSYFEKLRRHHMAHHFKTHDQRFGVSTWFWDNIFHTNPQ